MTWVENFCGLALIAGSFWLWETEMGKPGWTVCMCLCMCVCLGATRAPTRSHNHGAQGAPWEQPNQNLLKGTLTKSK